MVFLVEIGYQKKQELSTVHCPLFHCFTVPCPMPPTVDKLYRTKSARHNLAESLIPDSWHVTCIYS
jgi:hypothetical protein